MLIALPLRPGPPQRARSRTRAAPSPLGNSGRAARTVGPSANFLAKVRFDERPPDAAGSAWPGSGVERQAEPPTAWTPPSTWRISPVVIGKRSLKSATQALATARRVVHVPAERGPVGPGVLEGAETGDRLGRHGPDRPRRHEVDPDAARARAPWPGSARGTRAPPWPRPSSRRRARPPWRRSRGRRPRRRRPRPAAVEEGQEGVDERLEGVGGDVERHRDVVPAGGEHAAAEAVGRREADGVQQPVEAVPAGGQRLAGGGQLLG